MGSIIGIMNWRRPPTVAEGERMLLAAPHRGRQLRLETVGSALIGATNHPDESDATLAIDGRQGIAFAGSLDNQAELLADLGVRSSDATAAGTVLEAFAQWGPSMVERLRGAFAAVVVDGSTLWCLRDHLGFRPLFYRQEPHAAFCATEAKQVVAGSGINREPDLDALQLVYYKGISHDASLRGVKRLMVSEIIEIAQDRLEGRRYWDPTPLLETAKITLPEAREQLTVMLDQAVRRTLTGSDAVAMSGGLDSTTIAAFAAETTNHSPPFAYTFVYPEHPSVDESKFTRSAAESLGMRLFERTIESGPLDDLERWVDLADGPWDTLPIPWAVEGFRFARSQGATNVLYGDVAEYVFTVTSGLLGHLFYQGRWGALGKQLASRYRRSGSVRGVSLGLMREVLPRPLANSYFQIRRRPQYHHPPWIDPGVVGATRVLQLSKPQRHRWADAQVSATRGTTTTMEANEIAAAYAGVTIRRPLADVDLWEFFLSLPAEVKFPDAIPKSLLRQTMRGKLPDLILDRPHKTVFDEHALSNSQVDRLQLLINPATYRMPGVDYQGLADLLKSGSLSVNDVIWAQDLAKVHAFVDGFS